MRVSVLEVPDQKAALKKLAALVESSTVDPLVRNAAIAITQDCDQRDDDCEVNAIFNAVKYGDERVKGLESGLKYMSDPRWADFFTSPVRTLKQLADGYNGGDCLPAETLLLGAGFKMFPVHQAKVGDTIMGDGAWSKITQVWDKGVQPILEFQLNNGCVLRCTPEHKVFVVPKRLHRSTAVAGPREEAREVRASEVQLGDDLLTVQQLPEGRESLPEDTAWLLGMYIADGWVEYSPATNRPQRAFISGLDGWRKEGQKTRAEEICDRAGYPTRWHEKYLAMNNPELAAWLAAAGRYAPQKHVPSLDFNRATVEAFLSGLAADCDIRNEVFSTTSPELALQYRLMLRMTGVSAHMTRVDDHGGLGKHPIYRVTPRLAKDGIDRRPHARVKSISEGEPTHTFDIEVEGHRFYLPETDLIVHNCDDHVALVCALLGSLGFVVGLRAWGKQRGEYTHVYSVVGLPKIDPSEMVPLDTTVDDSEVGWEPEGGFTLTAVLDGS